MSRAIRLLLPIFLVLSGLSNSYAIGTDRPSFSAAAAIVQPGMLQIETGVAFTFSDPEFTIPQALFRVPVMHELEFRLGLPSLVIGGDSSIGGSTNVEFKFATALNDTVAAGVLAYIALPSGDNAFFGDASIAGRALVDVFLGPVTLTNNAELAITPRDQPGKGPRQGRFSYSLMLGWGFAENWAAYGEGFTIYEPSMDDPELNFDGGLIYTPSENISLDLSMGVPVADADSTYVSIGFSVAGP